MPDHLSFNEADAILSRHEARFAGIEGVLGVGIAMREGRLRFVVAIEQEEVRQRIEDRTVEGYPVYVERVAMTAVGDCRNITPNDLRAKRSPADRLRYDGLIPTVVRWLTALPRRVRAAVRRLAI